MRSRKSRNLPPSAAGSPAAAAWRTIQADERLLELEVVQLHARVLVESVVALAQAVGGLERAARLLRIAVLEQSVADGEHFLGFLGFFALRTGFSFADSSANRRPAGGNDLFFLNCNEPVQCFTCHLSFRETRQVMFSSGKSNFGASNSKSSACPPAAFARAA